MLEVTPSPKDEDDFYEYYSEEPVTESDWHRVAIRYLEESLALHLSDRPDAYVSSNVFVYYRRGDKKRKVSPDVFVCFGSDTRARRVHKVWEHGVPFAVFEVTSETSRLADQGEKRATYTMMGVQEYYLFDPLGEYLPGKLRAYRREGDELMPVVCSTSVESPALGLVMEVEGELLRLRDRKTGKTYLTAAENYLRAEEERARAEEERARAEEERARAGEERARAEEERARAEEEHARAHEEHARAEEERARADRERSLREAAEARLRALEEGQASS